MLFFDPLYLLIMAPAMIFAIWAQAKVKGAFSKYAQVRTRRGLTGSDVAWAIVRSSGLAGVKVEPSHGFLTDHYDPRSRTLRLSEPVYASNSVAAIGVAAHEAGHSIQHAKAYFPLQVRSAWVPLAQFGSRLATPIIIGGFLLAFLGKAPLGAWVVQGGIVLFALVVAFTLITLPVEFDASRRAVAILTQQGIVTREEEEGVRKVLNAAALTYVAAAAVALMNLLYWILRARALGGGGRD